MGGSACEIVLDIVSEFGCRNDSGGICKLTILHWATPQGKVPLSGDDSWCIGYYKLGPLECFCFDEKRLMGYWRIWKMFPGHFSKYVNSS